MNFILQPWQLLVFILAGWIQRQQQAIIEFQNEQIKTLLERQGRKRIWLTDDQHRRLAVKGKALGRKALSEITTIVTAGLSGSTLATSLGEVRSLLVEGSPCSVSLLDSFQYFDQTGCAFGSNSWAQGLLPGPHLWQSSS